MTGPEHYAEAERLLSVAEGIYWEGPTAQPGFAGLTLAAAQVHATLALVAATAETRITTPQQSWGGMENQSIADSQWAKVAS